MDLVTVGLLIRYVAGVWLFHMLIMLTFLLHILEVFQF